MPGPLSIRYNGVQFKAPSADGVAGQALVTNGSKQLAFSGPFVPSTTVTASGDLLVGSGAGLVSRLAKGAAGTFLVVDAAGSVGYSRRVIGAGSSEPFVYQKSDDLTGTQQARIYHDGTNSIIQSASGVINLIQSSTSNSGAIVRIGAAGSRQAILESTSVASMGNNVLQLYGGFVCTGVEIGGGGDLALMRDAAGRLGIFDYGVSGRSYRDIICRQPTFIGGESYPAIFRSASGDPGVHELQIYHDGSKAVVKIPGTTSGRELWLGNEDFTNASMTVVLSSQQTGKRIWTETSRLCLDNTSRLQWTASAVVVADMATGWEIGQGANFYFRGGWNGIGTNGIAGNLIIKSGQPSGNAPPSSVIIQSTTPTTSGSTLQSLVDTLEITNGLAIFHDLPTSDPHVSGALWLNGGSPAISAG